jgi:putative FmdB family regulatory protein
MPTYEYACGACGHQWEEVQRIVEPPTELCPKCAKASAHRLISGGTNFILKGGGWYSDLYSSSKSSSKGSESSGSNASSPSTSSPSTDGASGASKSDGGKSEAKATTPSPATPATPASSGS